MKTWVKFFLLSFVFKSPTNSRSESLNAIVMFFLVGLFWLTILITVPQYRNSRFYYKYLFRTKFIFVYFSCFLTKFYSFLQFFDWLVKTHILGITEILKINLLISLFRVPRNVSISILRQLSITVNYMFRRLKYIWLCNLVLRKVKNA